jgi:carboxypeptidase PM20D1
MASRLKRFALGAAIALGALGAALLINTARQTSKQLSVAPIPTLAVDRDRVAATLSGAIRARTISLLDEPELNADQFQLLHAWLMDRFPLLHTKLKREEVGKFGLLFTWEGSDPKARPIALLAHQDVVPIAPGTEKDWAAEPFSGERKNGFVWGRGAWDDKANLVSQAHAIELLLQSGFQPARTIYLAFGADEEVGGRRSAGIIAALLKSRGVRLEFVLDEGLLITEGVVPGLTAPLALIGIAEKGYSSIRLRISATPGHASMPPSPGTSAIGMLSRALQRLDEEQLPAHLQGVSREMFETIAPEMHGFNRVALSNLWLFEPLVRRQLEQRPSSNAMLRTTTALTVVQAGNKDNVLPGRAEATINFRLLPGDKRAAVLEHVRQTVKRALGHERFELEVIKGGSEPSRISPTAAPSYVLLNRVLRETFPGTVVGPGLMVAATDTRHYVDIADNVYRFSPVRARAEDLARFHGTNERISETNLVEMVRFYHRLLSQATTR